MLCPRWLRLPVLLLVSGCMQPEKRQDDRPEYPVSDYIQNLNPHLKKGFNTEYAFYADLSRPSSEYRFFVINLKTRKIERKGLCCNGVTDPEGKVVYSNRPGSNCSSRGAYSIGHRYTGAYGTAYKLHGLEKTNSNAFRRFVVLHAHRCVPYAPVFFSICESEGCPTVNPDFLRELQPYINRSEKPLLLYIQ